MNEALFRIGGCYGSKGGDIHRIDSLVADALSRAQGHWFRVSRHSDGLFYEDGSRFADGSYFGDANDEGCLIPGELTQRDGAWVPVEEAKEEAAERQLDALADAVNAAMIARDEKPARISSFTNANTKPKPGSVVVGSVTVYPSNWGENRSPANPALAALTRSPDLTEARHQVCPDHALAARSQLIG